MKLYYSKGACSLAVRITLYELGIACEFEAVDLKTKKTEHNEDFFKINSKGAVPTLVLDTNEILTENAVIQQYLADYYKAETLLPPVTVFKRYKVLEWLNFISTELHKGFSPLFSKEIPEDIKEEIFIPALKRKFEYVNLQLEDRLYLTGEEFTIADSYLFVTVRWAFSFNIGISEMMYVTRYYEALQQRASIKKALEDEGL